MSDIFREVDEALQQEKLLKIWNEYKTTIIAALIILIVSSAATTAYNNWNSKRNAEETAALLQAINSDKPEEALQKVIQDTRKNHETIALMSAAGIALKDNKKAEAAELYKKIADKRSAPLSLRDLSRILYVQNADEPNADILKPLLSNEKSPWVWYARIEAAALAADQDNDFAKAIDYLKPFEKITTIPLSLKQRGNALRHVYEIKAQTKTEG